jgi:predicted molibdopterin-dependent oxidoreductase YjgC
MVSAFTRLGADDADLVHYTVDGQDCVAPAGEPLATSLLATGYLNLRQSPTRQTPRGAFCLMGVCQECAIHVDGQIAQACMTPVRAGMVVELRGVV